MDPSPQSGSSFPAGISSQSDAEAGGKMSLRHVWDKLVSVGRSPSTGSARAHHSLPPDARGHQQSEDTDASVDSQSLAESEGGSMQDPDPALREQFDRLGRRQKPVHHSHEDLSDDALSSDSDSSLGEPIHGDFTYNAGEGWKASDHSMNPDQQQQQQQSHNEDALATPRSLTRAPSSLPGEAGGPRYSHPVYGQADEGAAHLQHSSSDLDTEEEAAALELNFSRRRRHTNPADMNM